ncbi:multiple antibiotic resistance protein [Moraxella cuniculi DSM 21768]|uniref:UPF0056 membrane protein n=1 Tax=Moraxella cuniculi DSM 21768 TaxID=1122245 RepID=A0A1N7FUP3_9GAMM|nr:MarC family protein [Moraxella cuniculi]OOS05482.1 hypothetical protein B0189_06445 [Moraxella cuniculi]SIS04029.1 multiple antibiotic resistance protein [Moraxella cuniculi DSM 21768]
MDAEIVKIILAFVVLINPSSAVPLFINMSQGYDIHQKRKAARIACATVFITIAFFALFGEILLQGLGISLGSFRVAGGILLFLIALGMMSDGNNPAKPNEDELTSDEPKDLKPLTGSAVVPLAIPMMIGPGGISTVIIYSAQVTDPMRLGLIVLAGLCISIFCYVSLMAADKISQLLGDTGLNVINRIMGIILAALAIEIIVSGLRNIFPALL